MRSSSDNFRTGTQIQRDFDTETVRFAKLFVKAGWHVLSLSAPKRIDKLFFDVVLSEQLKLQPFQTNKKLNYEPSDIKSIF